VSALISEIARASEEQSASVGQFNATVTGLDNMTQRNAALAEQSTAAAASLAQQARELAAAIAVFTLDDRPGQQEPALAA
jgi:methyl-accepting chemotaxis protein